MNPFAPSHLPALRQFAAGGVVFFGLAFAALGEALTVVNAGFEDIGGETQVNEFTFGPLNGWQLYDPGSITNGGAGNTYFIGTMAPFLVDPENQPGVYSYFPGGAAEGSRVGIAFNFEGSGGQGAYGMRQVLSSTLQEGMTYTLRVDIGNIGSGFSMANDYYELSGFPGYRVELWAGEFFLARDDNSLSISDGQFGTSTVNFTPLNGQDGIGDNLEIRLINLNLVDPLHSDSDLEVDFDNVRLDAEAVPEPGTVGLLILAAGAAALGLRKARSS